MKLSDVRPDIAIIVIFSLFILYGSWPWIVREYEDATDEMIDQIPVGPISNVSIVPTNWNESMKTRIETEQGIFHIYGAVSLMKGVTMELKSYTSGRKYACLSDRNNCFQIVNTKY
ncbi:MAG: hypothetical protein FE835_19755 [Gammaproteobacteria bacterium]|nr:hypothetical protein [Gammaproteobacteria bacterium]